MKTKKKKNSRQFNRRFRKRFFTQKSVLVIIFALVILIVIAFGCQRQNRQAERYRESIEELSTEVRDIRDANEDLREEKEDMDSPEFKEKIARERLGMIDEDEYSLQQSEDHTGETEEAGENDTKADLDAAQPGDADESSGDGDPGDDSGQSDGDPEDDGGTSAGNQDDGAAE